MPTNRKRRSRTWQGELDDNKIEQLIEGPDHCLLSGIGYFRRELYFQMDEEQRVEVLAEMERDWRIHGARIMDWWKLGPDAPPICSVPWIFPRPGPAGTLPWAAEYFDNRDDQ
jgi:hypothetical protein